MHDPAIAVLAALSIVSLFAVVLMHVAVRRVLGRPVAFGGAAPAVSILKPLRGIDDGLVENLESFAKLRYPQFEILLGAEDPDDPALPVARAFQRRHPELPISVHVCDRWLGPNPKVNVLAGLASHARHGVLLISDSNVRVAPHFLSATAAEFSDPDVALVTNPVVGIGEETLGAAMENAHLNSFIAGGICATSVYANRACVLGKSMLFRRDVFESEIGWQALRGVLAEDYFFGRRLELRGWKIAIAPHPVTTFNQGWKPSRFLERHVRWSMLRRRLGPAAFCAELLLNPAPLAFVLFVLGMLSRDAGAAGLGLTVIGAKILLDSSLSRRLRGRAETPIPLRAMLAKDLLLPLVWIRGALETHVNWRGHRVRLGRHTRLFVPRPLAPAATTVRRLA